MDILGFALAVLLIELTPGPNMAWLITLVLGEGRKAGLAAMSGIALGLLANGLIAASGVAWLLTNTPWMASAMGFAGAAMMVYLAFEAWRTSGETSQSAVPKQTVGKHFAAGFLINLLNLKAALFFITVAPQFIDPAHSGLQQTFGLALISVTIATAVHFALIFAASTARPLLMLPKRAKQVRRVLALVMLGVAAWFIRSALT